MKVLKPKEVVEAMLEYVKRALILEDRGYRDKKIEGGKEDRRVFTFTGRGVTEEDKDVPFALDVIINIAHRNIALGEKGVEFLQDLHKSREGTCSGMIFPRSTDYPSPHAEFQGPYCKQVDLLKTTPQTVKGKYRFVNSREDNFVKFLSRAEFEYAMQHCDDGKKSLIAYYNPAWDYLEVTRIISFKPDVVIPEARSHNGSSLEYFWRFIYQKSFPSENDYSKDAQTFRKIQEGLHHRVKMIRFEEEISDSFTLARFGQGAIPVSYHPLLGRLSK